MSSEAPAPRSVQCDAAPVAWARAVFRKQAHIVRRLVEKGMEIAKGLALQARPAPSQASAPGAGRSVDLLRLAVLFDRVSRAVRMAILLETRLAAGLGRPDAEIAAEIERARAAAGSAAEPRAPTLNTAHAAPPKAPEADEPGRGLAEAAERLADADQRAVDRLCRYVQSRPVEEVIARICRLLGLGPDWLRRAEAAWACEQLPSRKPGSRPNAMPARKRLSFSASPRALCPGPIRSDVKSGPWRLSRPP